MKLCCVSKRVCFKTVSLGTDFTFVLTKSATVKSLEWFLTTDSCLPLPEIGRAIGKNKDCSCNLNSQMEFLYHKVEFLYHNNVGVIIPRILIYRLKTVSNEYMCSSVYCDAKVRGQNLAILIQLCTKSLHFKLLSKAKWVK